MDYSTLRYELETDSLGSIIDTSGLTCYKYDDEHHLLFKEREWKRYSAEYLSMDYYCGESKVEFYQERTMANGKYNSLYEAFFNKCGVEEEAVMYFFGFGSPNLV